VAGVNGHSGARRPLSSPVSGIVAKKTDETRRRWDVAVKDRNFDCIRNLPVAETRPEHFDRALADGKVSTNVYLRRIHNHALGMEWLLKSVIPRLQWPKPVFGVKRAITAEEHAAIIGRELDVERRNRGSRNSDQPHYDERRDFYELLWHPAVAPGVSVTQAVLEPILSVADLSNPLTHAVGSAVKCIPCR
jgi:hypothetical protein